MREIVKRVEAILDKAVPLLGLQGWNFEIRPVSAQKVREATARDTEAYSVIFLDRGTQQAAILVNDEDTKGLEHTIIHELLHTAASDVGLEKDKAKGLVAANYEAFLDRIASSIIRAKEKNVRRTVRH